MVLNYFIRVKRRIIPCRTCESKGVRRMDMALMIFLGISVLFSFIRILGALLKRQRHLQAYVQKFEPVMAHPSAFGAVWVVMAGLYSIPCCVLGILYLRRFACRKSLNMALFHAGCLLQGTFAYISFWKLVSADAKFKVPPKIFVATTILNLLPVIAAHGYMFRCLKSGLGDDPISCQILNDEVDDEEEAILTDEDDEDGICFPEEEEPVEELEQCEADDDDICEEEDDACLFDDDDDDNSLRNRIVRFLS